MTPSARRFRTISVPLLLTLVALRVAPASAGIRFEEASEDWGLVFRHHHGGSGELYMPETMGSGVVVFDYDGDGDRDVFFVDSGPLPGYSGEPTGSRLFRNLGGRRFEEVPGAGGIEVDSYGMGATAGDVDADGDMDLYVTAFGTNRLFVNRGDGTFEEATDRAGVGDPSWGASAAFGDADRDGDLDLYVTNYVDFALDRNKPCGPVERGLRSYCHPDVYPGLPDRFYRNRGDGTFEDATAEAGFGKARGKGLGVLFGDVDGDGWPDVYVANDMTANFLFKNRGDGSFEEIGLITGVAYSGRGDPEAGMGVDMGDLDGDGNPEIMVTHLDLQSNAFYSRTDAGIFVDSRFRAKVAEVTYHDVGFGLVFSDLDQDGHLDIAVANGHIIHNIELWGSGGTFRQRNLVLQNLGDGRYREVADHGLDVVESSRGLAAGDLDLDGDPDLVISNSNARSEAYRNVTPDAGHWLEVDLVSGSGEAFGVGSRIVARAGRRTMRREVRTGSSYQSQNQLTCHFGLGEATEVEALEVTWSRGERQRIEGLPADRRVRLYGPPSGIRNNKNM